MLSDALHEAVEEIEKYQRDYPKVYDAMKDEIEPVKVAMNKLRQKLDAPPSVPC
jgi:hypothetical protein